MILQKRYPWIARGKREQTRTLHVPVELPRDAPISKVETLNKIDWQSRPLLASRIFRSQLYQYRLGKDLYVYQFTDGKPCGWLCDYPSWQRHLHKSFSDDEIVETPWIH